MTTVTGKLTILADNTVSGKSDLLGEHGFSIYLETSQGNFLFDTGKGKTIVHNATRCRKDLGAIKAIILSHGHADHTGGNETIGSAGAVIIAHDNIRKRMTTEQVSIFMAGTPNNITVSVNDLNPVNAFAKTAVFMVVFTMNISSNHSA